MTQIHLLLFPLLIFLFPVAVYCWALAMVNRRLRPLMVSGPWDFVGLLFAASGFLLVAGPALLTGLYNRALREPPLVHRGRSLATLWWDLLSYDWFLWLAYYTVVLGGALLLLWCRRRKTIIYNVDPALLETILVRGLANLGLPWARQGNRFYLGAGAVPVQGKDVPVVEPPAPPMRLATPAVLDLQPFSAMSHVTLHWRGPGSSLRQEVETELEKALAEVQTPDNPASTWLLGVAGCLFGLMFFCALLLILGGFLGPRRW